MTQTYEISDFDSHTPFKCAVHHIGHIRAHMHDFFEIIFILSGRCRLMIEDKLHVLDADDLIIVESHTLHELRASDCVYASVQLDQTTLENNFPVPMHPKFECSSKQPGKEDALGELRRLIARLIQNNADRQTGYELRNWILVYQLMEVLFLHFRVERTEAVDRRNHRYASRISEISAIVNEHYREELPLSKVADMVHLSPPYLSKFFIEQFGINYLAYLTQIRVNHAVHELLNTEKNIEEIAADNGFPNSHAFTQAFKKEYGTMPSVYRRMQKKNKSEPSMPSIEYHDYLAGLQKYLDTEASSQLSLPALSAHGSFSVADVQKKLRHTWRNTVSVGKASDLLLSDVQKILRRAKKEIGYQYIYFNGIFSDDLYVYSIGRDGAPVYNFGYIDRIFDFLSEIGLLPFLQLSYMPAALAKYPDKILFNHLVSEPRELPAWCGLVRAFLEHVIRRYGREAVRQWKFSVWHQPNTSAKLYGFERDSDFYHFYQNTRSTIKDVDPLICFGLPAICGIVAEEYSGWYPKMLRWCQENDCVPDFIDFSFYDIQAAGTRNNSRSAFGFVFMMTLNNDSDGLKAFIHTIKKELRSLSLENLPVYLNEWNSTPSQQDLLNDTCFKSCYIAKNILENYDRTDSLSYWSLSDLMSEAPLPDSLLFGGLGLFTANGLPKASYYALTLLRQLGDQFLAKGEGWFATRTDTDIRIITYHYFHFSHLYAVGEQFIMTARNRYTMFDSAQPLDLTLQLEALENRSYSVKQYIVGRQCGSLFDTWAETGFMNPDSSDDQKILAARSMPGMVYSEIDVQNHTCSLHVHMEPLEVRLIILK